MDVNQTPATASTYDSPQPQPQPQPHASASASASKNVSKRWMKRLLLLTVLAGLAIGSLASVSSKPQLLPQADQVRGTLEPSIREVVDQVDLEMERVIQSERLAAAEPADSLILCRRLSLALVGNGLSLEEVRALQQIPEETRATWWLDYLLRDRRSADYLAERWTRATVGTNAGPFLVFRRRMYVEWLADQFSKNVPYDRIVRELITAQGAWTDSPQVNFLTATMDEGDDKQPDVIRLAGRTSRAFLAQRIDCLQCHDDYVGNVPFPNDATHAHLAPTMLEESVVRDGSEMREGTQEDFHQLAAFFAGTRMENPFIGLRNTNRPYRYQYLHAEEETEVPPSVPYLQHLLPEKGSPRDRLAKWVTHPENKAFARAAVNRVWAILFGKPWTPTIDNIPLSGPFPAGMETLADDLIQSGYDLHRLIRAIASTKAFQRDSRLPGGEPDEDHEAVWAVFPLTQLRPEQVAASIHQASRVKTIDESSSIISRLELFGGVNDFTKEYGDRGDDEFQANAITIPQRLLVMNGKFTRERIEDNPVMNASTRIANQARDDRSAVEAVFLAVLNRRPSEREWTAFAERLAGTKGNKHRKIVEDMYWTLMNSTEFLWNH